MTTEPINTDTLRRITSKYMVDSFTAEIEHSRWIVDILLNPGGWPRRFHLFPRLDSAGYWWSQMRWRVRRAIDELRGHGG